MVAHEQSLNICYTLLELNSKLDRINFWLQIEYSKSSIHHDLPISSICQNSQYIQNNNELLNCQVAKLPNY